MAASFTSSSVFKCNPATPPRPAAAAHRRALLSNVHRPRHLITALAAGQPTQPTANTAGAPEAPVPDRLAAMHGATHRRALLQLAGATLLAQAAACCPALAEQQRLSADQVAEVIRRDFSEGQYYVTGKLTADVFDPDCVFIDPTTRVKGVKPYTTAVANLFDPATSHADLISLQVVDSNTILLRWRLEGKLKLGGLSIKPYTGSTVYTLNADGRVASHVETWDISALDAFVSTFLPSFGAPPAPPIAAQS